MFGSNQTFLQANLLSLQFNFDAGAKSADILQYDKGMYSKYWQ